VAPTEPVVEVGQMTRAQFEASLLKKGQDAINAGLIPGIPKR
jgi:hypothetical protein